MKKIGAKFLTFQTDAAAVTGMAAEINSGLTFFRSPMAVDIVDIIQVAGAAVNNDADWHLWVDYKDTGIFLQAEAIDPASVGRTRLVVPIRIHPGAIIQFEWAGQAAAQANNLSVQLIEHR